MDRMELFYKDNNEKIKLGLLALDGTELFYRETIQITNLINLLGTINTVSNFEKEFKTVQELEAVYSSEVEGYSTTRMELTKFINKERTPKTKDEKAVYNNYLALEHGIVNKNKLCSLDNNVVKDFILQLNSLILSTNIESYRLEPVDIVNRKGEVVHEGLPFATLETYMNSLIDFIQDSKIEPLVTSCIIHYYFVYIHPFIDGNGRTARALSYLYLIAKGHKQYNLFSISYMLPNKRKQYYTQLSNISVSGYDLTEFIEFMLTIMIEGINDIEDKYQLLNVLNNIKSIYKIYGLEYTSLTETLVTFIYTKDNFNVNSFYKKIRSKFIRNGYTDEQLKNEIHHSIDLLVDYNIIDTSYKINDKIKIR